MLGRWSSEYLVQRQERSHGRGIPDHPMRPTTRSTPVRRQGQPQTEIRSCENPRMRVCSPTSQGFAPTVARSSYQQLLARLWRGRAVAPPRLTKDIRGWAKAPARNADVTKALAWRRAHVSVASANAALTDGYGARTAALFEGGVWVCAPLPILRMIAFN